MIPKCMDIYPNFWNTKKKHEPSHLFPRLGITISLKKPPCFFVVLGCPEQRIKELSDVRLVIQAMSHLVARWGEVAEESRFATWKKKAR